MGSNPTPSILRPVPVSSDQFLWGYGWQANLIPRQELTKRITPKRNPIAREGGLRSYGWQATFDPRRKLTKHITP